ncbi:MAG: phosphoribosylaminoimidazolesuccinocarboxamide synthase [Euryarchaeota archaeon]|nr:phosphoribosylaminoimidazolesuccinocarboxamide synthase [Euryarchaeota archaeon]
MIPTDDLNSMKKIIEGKTKAVYENIEDKETVYMYFKDDITAGDGLKHDIIEGKSVINWRVNRNIFEYLNRAGVRTHYIDSPRERVAHVKRLNRKINLEVVTRRVATGSILGWGDAEEGKRFDPVITQFHYKDDPLHDPMLDDGYVGYLIEKKGVEEYSKMQEMNVEVFLLLEKAFAQFNIQLMDMKLEYGIINDKVYLIDEITGGSFRLWPYAHENPDLTKENVLSELDPSGRLDKDIYRMGDDFEKVKSKFGRIAEITARFKDLKIK